MSIAGGRGYSCTGEGFFIEDFVASRLGDEPVYVDKHLVVTWTDNPSGLRFAGEIDVTNSAAVAESVRGAVRRMDEPHLDVSRVSFCDISGIRALVDSALAAGEGRRMWLHGLPPQLQTVMRATGWAELPQLALCSCEGGEG